VDFNRGGEGGEGGGEPEVELFGGGSFVSGGGSLVFQGLFQGGPVSVFPPWPGSGQVGGGWLDGDENWNMI